MYQSSAESMNVLNRLRNLLGGGGGGGGSWGSAQDTPTKPAAAPTVKSIFSGMPELPGAPGGILDPTGEIANNYTPAPPEAPDFLAQFLQSMAGQLGGSGTGLNQKDYEEALKNSAAQIKGAFGAEIGAVKASSAAAKHQTKKSKQQIKAMYNALSRQYDKGAAGEVGQGQQIANALQGVATNAAGELKGTSDQMLADQAALAKNLGVESALPTVAATQQNDISKQIGNIVQYGARQAGDQIANSGSQQRYLVRGGKNALLEGTNKRADLVGQLQAFLMGNMGKIADIKGQQGQSLAANASSVAKSFGDAANKNQQDSWNKQKDYANLLMQFDKMKSGEAAANSKSSSGSGDANIMKLMQLLSQTAASSQDPKKIAEVYKLLQGALQAQAGG